MLTRQLAENRHEVENEYKRIVHPDGNQRARKSMDRVFQAADVAWRGFPVIAASGLVFKKKYTAWDARKQYEDFLEPVWNQEWHDPPGCRCGEVLRGILAPSECPLFGKQCSPMQPIGPCMVSAEGTCQIEYRYRKRGI